MCAYGNAVERAVILCHKIVTALGYVAFDALVFLLIIHDKHLFVSIYPFGQGYYARLIVNYS